MAEVSASSTIEQPFRTGSKRRHAMTVLEWIAPYAIIVPILISWALATHFNLVMPFLMPSPFAVARWMMNDLVNGNLTYNVAITLYRTMMGFALAAVSGVAIGIVMARVGAVRWFFDPILSIMLPMPAWYRPSATSSLFCAVVINVPVVESCSMAELSV